MRIKRKLNEVALPPEALKGFGAVSRTGKVVHDMWNINAVIASQNEIEWHKPVEGNTQHDGIKVSFSLPGQEQWQETEAVKFVQSCLKNNSVAWIGPGPREWVFDLQELKNEHEELAHLDWLVPKIAAAPKLESKQHPNEGLHRRPWGGPTYTSWLAFYLEREVAQASFLSSPNKFWELIHPKITAIARTRFESNHPADAVEAAFKEINATVKTTVKDLTGEELDGAVLMGRAFSPQKPILKVADLTTISGQDIQKGYLQIFSGSMTAIRNPKAHDNLAIDSLRAIHLLFLASLLMHKLDEGKDLKERVI